MAFPRGVRGVWRGGGGGGGGAREVQNFQLKILVLSVFPSVYGRNTRTSGEHPCQDLAQNDLGTLLLARTIRCSVTGVYTYTRKLRAAPGQLRSFSSVYLHLSSVPH